MSSKTYYGYLVNRSNITYIGLITGRERWTFRFRGMSVEEAHSRLKFQHLRTNVNIEKPTLFDKAMFESCKLLCEKAYKIDVGLAYQVQGGRYSV